MYSLKPGRATSLGGAVAGVIMVVIGLLWMVGMIALFAEIGPDGTPMAFKVMFVGFGIVFVLMGIAAAVTNFYNATARNRMSVLDLTRGTDEPDPIAQALGHVQKPRSTEASARFCPACGATAAIDHRFCAGCGKEL